MTRFLPSVPGLIYAHRADTLYVNLFVGSRADITLDDGRIVQLVQETRYPWDGKVRISVHPQTPGRFTIKVRIPGWARDEAVPSDLYRFVGKAQRTPPLTINGSPVEMHLEPDRGYATLEREWQPGDTIGLDLPVLVRYVEANKRVQADRGKVALQRGPLVYCVEWPDNPGHVHDLALPPIPIPALLQYPCRQTSPPICWEA